MPFRLSYKPMCVVCIDSADIPATTQDPSPWSPKSTGDASLLSENANQQQHMLNSIGESAAVYIYCIPMNRVSANE